MRVGPIKIRRRLKTWPRATSTKGRKRSLIVQVNESPPSMMADIRSILNTLLFNAIKREKRIPAGTDCSLTAVFFSAFEQK